MTSPSAVPPPPVLFVRDPELLTRIREQITAPPDPQVLPWAPPPDYDAQAVAINIRLERAARAKKSEPPPPQETKTRVRSAFASEAPKPEGKVDFSTSATFFDKAEVIAPARRPGHEPEPAPERPAPTSEAPPPEVPTFGVALGGGRPRKKDPEPAPEARRRPRATEDDFLGRLKTEFRKS